MANEKSFYSLEEITELLDSGFFDQDEEIKESIEAMESEVGYKFRNAIFML